MRFGDFQDPGGGLAMGHGRRTKILGDSYPRARYEDSAILEKNRACDVREHTHRPGVF